MYEAKGIKDLSETLLSYFKILGKDPIECISKGKITCLTSQESLHVNREIESAIQKYSLGSRVKQVASIKVAKETYITI